MGSQRRRQSAEVYRRRRILVGVLAVVLLVLVGWLAGLAMGGGPGSQEDEPGPDSAGQDADAGPDSTGSAPGDEDGSGPDTEDSQEAEDPDSDPEPSPDQPPEDGSCRSGDLEVRASTGSEAYGPGYAPMLVMEVENTADYACEADLGTEEQEFLVEHGGAVIFSTAECSVSRESLPVQLEPGQVEQAHFRWPRSDSAEDCAEPAALNPGRYELTVSLSGVRSEPHDFSLNEG
ncbi:hypothetical protein I2485_10775 [Nesterenkonia sp. E16_7]|uniref:hypothetical protein n=1 Tax=unclassified Nesterenkonia TaxID=2629769 RepID=UPI001A926A8A|nr:MULTISPECIES: hypothetical protein [unclassified Nesterenkonia]MBO0595424.1 hypothetical protein [Nesterenkonia sp. E16_10]MBO0599128.1 hypothetical protein [Nesterenkonia sp. E16_7]